MIECKDVLVEEQQALGEGHFILRLRQPELAAQCRAGQFVMLGLPELGEMLIRRPFSVARVDGEGADGCIEVLYRVVGRYTEAFSRLGTGARLSVLGPLGRGFWLPDPRSGTELLLVAGGIGNAPFPLLVQQYQGPREKLSLFYGGRSAGDLTLTDWFEEHCGQVVLTTDDGSRGRQGLVTAPLVERLDGNAGHRWVFACGPQPMLRAVSEICLERDVPCQLALEETMACGFGVCLGCVVPRREPRDEFDRYVRVCTEGPVFDAREILP